MLYVSENSTGELYKEISKLFCGINSFKSDVHEIDNDIIKAMYERLNSSDNNVQLKNESHPPIEYYRDKINNNITYNINININTSPPKKPKKDLLDIVIKIIKLITLISGLYSLSNSDDDSSDNNLRLQLT